jgi:preprotein translocase subunit SecA
MLKRLISFLGDSSDKQIDKLRPIVDRINTLEPEIQKLSEAELPLRTAQFRERLSSNESLEQLLPEVFAVVRETAQRTIGLRHFDVQMIGGIILHQGKIAEMKTGEGKTLVATLSLYLNALEGKGTHLITVNDYLAKRDIQWMGPVYHALGLSVGCLQHEAAYIFDPGYNANNPGMTSLRPVHRSDAYQTDIIYGTNSEFGFDYLRDNMIISLSDTVQRKLHYAIVDEVDNILIDEARTPLIISGPAQESTNYYTNMSKLATRLNPEEDYVIDEKDRIATLTENGISKTEKWLNVNNLYDPENYLLTHYVENALRAEVLSKRDRDYVVRNGEVIIVDEFTGRLMNGRRYADGLHQAIEAKEGLRVQPETITYATITLQNYFRMYGKLAGMTGTAATEAEEFWKIYRLDVALIPTHKPMIRKDRGDLIFKSEDAKFRAVVKEIEKHHRAKQPVLVGTVSIAKSERLSELLKRHNIPHQVLNAKHHEREAVIVAEAGKQGSVTVATNMAGRGTDIVLGGDPKTAESSEQWGRDHENVVTASGLHIVGTERHEARRIDNQLRGRSGRQGDPGSTQFFVSVEDDIVRRFGGDRIKSVMNWAGIDDDSPLESRLISKAIAGAQSKVEAHNFDIRKHLVEYDDVINMHRDIIYGERHKILSGADLKTNIQSMLTREISELVTSNLSGDPDGWKTSEFLTELSTIYTLPEDFTSENILALSVEEVEERSLGEADRLYQQRETEFSEDHMRALERLVMLRIIDNHWVQHLTAMSNLRQSIGLHAYGQRDPLVMYKKEGHEMFDSLLARIQHDIAHTVFHVAPADTQHRPSLARNVRSTDQLTSIPTLLEARQGTAVSRVVENRQTAPVGGRSEKIGRNDPCHCGSNKKYKKCHGGSS